MAVHSTHRGSSGGRCGACAQGQVRRGEEAGSGKARRRKAAPKSGGKNNAEFSFKNPKAGVYSFASGYKDAKEITVTVTYDADKHAFGVVSEGYITDSGDSHVAIINTDDFSIQIEYAPYYHGEDFAALERSVAENYKNFGKVSFKNAEGSASQTAAATAWRSRPLIRRPTMC